MTWTVVFSLVIGIVIKMIMSPPSAVVAWITSKFALHAKLNPTDVNLTYNGKHLDEEEKIKFIDYFNEATFLRKNHIFPGNEKLFLHPETNVTPVVMNVSKGKTNINIYVYRYDDHLDIVKQYKKKVVSYSVRSDKLSTSTKVFSVNAI
ncbi:uncharacterized protein YfmQ [Cytobacillus horneckiae]|uniref:YfmQ family protein n=1 Tax=Cytobacillus horneckiae TaxID=549687 RepID=UPI0019D1C4C3|nr:YfmQ family protein [Cytobacillus horneckiae]MBN6886414.1 hypothetical protein [Cytobacillus horneckiae]MCM3176657.1 YfmQ family protein [Cytobacillus horneckiae]